MKKRIIIFMMALLLVVPLAMAFESSWQSAEKTATATITTGAGVFHGLIVSSDGTNAVTVDIYDNTSAAGKLMIPTWTVTTSSSNRVQSLSIGPPVKFTNGIHVVITCAGTMSYMVYFNKL